MNIPILILKKILKLPDLPDEIFSDKIKILKPSYSFFLYSFSKKILKEIPSLMLVLFFFLFISVNAVLQKNLIMLAISFVLLGIIVCFSTLFLLYSFFILSLDYEMRRYIITDTYIKIREGILTTREITLSLANLQSISVSQGPLQRLFCIADIQLQTAGKKNLQNNLPMDEPEEYIIPYKHITIMGLENYQEIKNQLMASLKKYKDSGLGQNEISAYSTRKNKILNPKRKILLCEIRNEISLISLYLQNEEVIKLLQ